MLSLPEARSCTNIVILSVTVHVCRQRTHLIYRNYYLQLPAGKLAGQEVQALTSAFGSTATHAVRYRPGRGPIGGQWSTVRMT